MGTNVLSVSPEVDAALDAAGAAAQAIAGEVDSLAHLSWRRSSPRSPR